jgi:hypothetical protein
MKLAYHRNYFLRSLANLWSPHTPSAALEALGIYLALTETIDYVAGSASGNAGTHHSWYWLVGLALFALIYAAWRRRPPTKIACRVKNQDVTVEIAVGDIFSFSGSLIIGSNTTFDTNVSQNLIARTSIQGIFTEKYYSSPAELDTALEPALNGLPHTELLGHRVGKGKEYPIGTCVRVNTRERSAYLLALAKMNAHGVAQSSFQDLQDTLPKLWEFIATRGSKEDLLIPVLGTGFSRLLQSRQDVIREIILSFLAACTERTFCDKLTIVIAPQDLAKNNISIESLGDFLGHHCRYRAPRSQVVGSIGTPAT